MWSSELKVFEIGKYACMMISTKFSHVLYPYSCSLDRLDICWCRVKYIYSTSLLITGITLFMHTNPVQAKSVVRKRWHLHLEHILVTHIKFSLLTVTGKKGNRWSLSTIRVGKYQWRFHFCLFHSVVNYCTSRTAITYCIYSIWP